MLAYNTFSIIIILQFYLRFVFVYGTYLSMILCCSWYFMVLIYRRYFVVYGTFCLRYWVANDIYSFKIPICLWYYCLWYLLPMEFLFYLWYLSVHDTYLSMILCCLWYLYVSDASLFMILLSTIIKCLSLIFYLS